MPSQEICWCKYPQALYPNWTPRQQKKSKIAGVIATKHDSSTIYVLDVIEDGIFVNLGKREVRESTQDEQWRVMQEEVCGVHSCFASSSLIVWFGTRTDPKVFEYGQSSWTVYQDRYYRCLVHDIISNRSSSRPPSAGYPLVTNPMLKPMNLIVSL